MEKTTDLLDYIITYYPSPKNSLLEGLSSYASTNHIYHLGLAQTELKRFYFITLPTGHAHRQVIIE